VRVLSAIRFLLALGVRVDCSRLVRAVLLMLAGCAAAPLGALALAHFTDDALSRRFDAMAWSALVTAALYLAYLMFGHFAHLDYFELAEMQETRLRAELTDIVNRPDGIEHLDSSTFADNLNMVRETLVTNARALEAVLQLAGQFLQMIITTAILITLSPWLAFLPLMAAPSVWLAGIAQAIIERARERVAEQNRLNNHLIEMATDSASVKEARIFGAEPELLRRQTTAWNAVAAGICRGQTVASALQAAGQLFFAIGYGSAIYLLVRQAGTGHATIGGIVLVITLAVQVSAQITGSLELLAMLQFAGGTAERIKGLRAMGLPTVRSGSRPVPAGFRRGIVLEHVGFCYPGSAEPALHDICLEIGAGQTLAVVGENGAGKSTLVKLLCGLYTPTSGRILADGVDLAELDLAGWRAKVATLFQDFYRFEFTLREGVGLGEVAHLSDDAALASAVSRARAHHVVDAVPGGLDGYTGRAYDDGVQLSGGQWQLIGLARCLMRTRPRLLILDEPTAALDAAAEHAMFERYASSASSAARELGGITILISHRFSTVVPADKIAVLADGTIAEYGTHRELMAHDGVYAELFQLQAKGYQP
jgi:ATP-binding cassette subfamily B protein